MDGKFLPQRAQRTHRKESLFFMDKPTKTVILEVDLCVPCVLCGEFFL
jgi:hypothetical protein